MDEYRCHEFISLIDAQLVRVQVVPSLSMFPYQKSYVAYEEVRDPTNNDDNK